ncbi:aspartic peptidase domain-containing protein [Boeremia exigua]|uniref:aspartic peptidase domain-containing protein n=1 Tax=Boeremia exigua TaxID=749465 RepID=UPI001E8D3D98|nr:aspartic peptidase domain-containing protein [Boeremia exigua]KAH6612371.1 aspartic peptidase domain-containing protein [Boeremia exigua]
MSGLPSPLVVPNSGNWIGNDGSWSTFSLQVGTPPQPFQVLPSISGQTIYVPVDEDCAPERMNITDCGFKRGVGVVESRPSLGFQRNKSSTWEGVGAYEMDLGSNLGLTGSAYYGYDNVIIGSSQDVLRVERPAVAAYATPDFWIGQLGLSNSPVFMNEANQPISFLSMLKEKGNIPSLSFGYQAGSPVRLTKVTGSLILGGHDRSRQSNTSLTIPLNPGVVVGLQSISITTIDGTSKQVLSNGIIATIDTNTPDMWLPTSVCDELASQLGLTYSPETDRYVIYNEARSAIKSSSPTFSFVIGSSATGGSTIPIEIPYTALDLQAAYPIFSAPAYYFPIRRAANESQITLGRAFLQEIYLSVDWERSIFNISQALFNIPPLAQEIVTIEPMNKTSGLIALPNSKTQSLSIGAIVGIAVGAVGLILLIILGWWFHSRKRNRRDPSQMHPDQPEDFSTDGKEFAGVRTDHMSKQGCKNRTDLELDGEQPREMYAPLEYYGQAGHFTELVEAEAPNAIHELPGAVHELSASNEQVRTK